MARGVSKTATKQKKAPSLKGKNWTAVANLLIEILDEQTLLAAATELSTGSFNRTSGWKERAAKLIITSNVGKVYRNYIKTLLGDDLQIWGVLLDMVERDTSTDCNKNIEYEDNDAATEVIDHMQRSEDPTVMHAFAQMAGKAFSYDHATSKWILMEVPEPLEDPDAAADESDEAVLARLKKTEGATKEPETKAEQLARLKASLVVGDKPAGTPVPQRRQAKRARSPPTGAPALEAAADGAAGGTDDDDFLFG